MHFRYCLRYALNLSTKLIEITSKTYNRGLK
jgi:hypothetical protein